MNARTLFGPVLILAILGLCQPMPGQVSYLDNGNIKIGVDLGMGGSITYLSQSNSTYNVVNSADLGREIQQSFYSGPYPYDPNGTQHSAYAGWGWNPVQSGDVYGNRSTVLASSNDGNQIYVKTLPLQWALDNVPTECFMETWITLNGKVATVRCRLTNHRTDTTQLWARQQELPAVYTVGTLDHLYTYNGSAPFTGGALTEILNAGPPWTSWLATENWSAYVNSSNWGLGVYNPGAAQTIGGFAGTRGTGGPANGPTGYISPLHTDFIDANIVYDFQYYLILDTLTNIRNYVYAHQPVRRPDFRFANDRQHWVFSNAADSWPVEDKLHLTISTADPRMYSPFTAFQASDVSKIYVRAAYHLNTPVPAALSGQLFWAVDASGTFSTAQSVTFPIINDGQYHTYVIDMSSVPNWTGQITRLRLDPSNSPKAGDQIDIEYVSAFPGYDADGLPTAANPVWIANYSADSFTTTINNGDVTYAHIDSIASTGDRPYYTYAGGSGTQWNVVDKFTYEMRARIVSHAGYTRAGSVLVYLLDGTVARLYFQTNAVGFVTTSNMISLDASQWHTYRITGVKTSGVWSLSLYIDGVLASTTSATSAAGSTITWGDLSATGTTEGGIWDVDYIRWNDKQAIEPPAPQWYPYSFKGNVLPTTASPVWTETNSANTKSTVNDKSYLQIDSRIASNPYYTYAGGSGTAWDLGSELTVEMRAKVLEQTGTAAACSLWMGTGTEGTYLNLGTNSVTFGGNVISLDATQWHVYRVIGTKSNNDWTWKLYIDNGAQSWTHAGSTQSPYNVYRLLFGDPGSAYGGREHIDYIRWNPAEAIAP